jgi:3-deoxy-manno-octulosonate cytidylyltransferase (CMP-KDO synthetase)
MPPDVTIIIPARLGSTRFPRKMLADATGKAMILHVVDAARAARCARHVAVATDSDEIARAVRNADCHTVITSHEHASGTSRLAQAAQILGLPEDEIIVNVQGDEPEIEPALIDAAADHFARSPHADAATLASPINADSPDFTNPNVVKVVRSPTGLALYFSRSPIPYARSTGHVQPLRHIGIYVYPRRFLDLYHTLPPTPLEQAEQLEQLRVLEHGRGMAVGIWPGHTPTGIDTPEQYDAFVRRWRNRTS